MNSNSLHFFRMIRDFLEKYLIEQKASSHHTKKAYKTALNQFLDYSVEILNIPISEFCFQNTTIQLVENFLVFGEEIKHWSTNTRNQKLAAVRAFYKYAAGHDISLISYYQELLLIPVKIVKETEEIAFFSEDNLQLLLEQPDTTTSKGIRDLVFMIIMYDTACRIQEILDIKLNALHLDEKSPYITITGKGSKTRLVPLMEKTVSHLKRYMQRFHKNGNGNDYLFYTIHQNMHSQMSPDNAQKFIDKYCKKAHSVDLKVPIHIYCHMFRHSRSMHLYRSGMPLPLLSEWLGHAQVDTTRKYYANANTAMKQDAINKATSELNPILQDDKDFDFENDEELLKRLYGLI